MEIPIQFGSFASCLGVLVHVNWDEGIEERKRKIERNW